MIPYACQFISEDDIIAVTNVLRSTWLTQGPTVTLFEKAVATYCGAQYAVALTNATSALHLACLVLGLGKNDYLWTSPNTFVASANCGLYCGANIDFIDIDPLTYNISINALSKKLQKAKINGTLPKIIVAVHFAGQPCDMQSIKKLARQYHIYVIEDASHAIGACYLGNRIGNGHYSDMTIFSFHPVKLITTGEGGMVLTNNLAWYKKLELLRSHGITRDTNFMNQYDGEWYYQQIDLGYNYRMTDIQAALGLSQLQQLDKFIEKRRYLAKRYFDKLNKLPIILPYQDSSGLSAWHLYVIKIKSKLERNYVFNQLRKKGIHVNVHYIPIHLQPYYQRLGFKSGDYPIAESYYHDAISLPLYYDLTNEKQDYIINQLCHIFSA